MQDLIERQAVIDAALTFLVEYCSAAFDEDMQKMLCERLDALPSAQPEIIHCRECKFASGNSRICMKFGHSPIGELDFCAWAERKENR